MTPNLLRPSGLNNRFDTSALNFPAYIQQMQEMLKQARVDLNANDISKIIQANSPFEWYPAKNPSASNRKIKNGVLLIHGLYDSPFTVMDIGKHFLAKDFLVRAILLPGHGTVPGDLLNIQYPEWIKATHYGLESLRAEVENIFVVGFSMGATLAIHEAITNPIIQSLCLIGPALKARNPFVPYLIKLARFTQHFYRPHKWYKVNRQKSFAKYESMPVHAADQACKLMHQTCDLLQKKPLEIPVFAVISKDDETLDANAVVNFVAQESNPNNRLIIYTNQPNAYSDSRIEQRSSFFPEQRILDFSHVCLPISPNNTHYGKHGDYQDFQAYPNNEAPNPNGVFQGAINKQNMSQHIIQRLSYNPDFDYMISALDQFLGHNILHNPEQKPASHTIDLCSKPQ